jgi:hypothetical protein
MSVPVPHYNCLMIRREKNLLKILRNGNICIDKWQFILYILTMLMGDKSKPDGPLPDRYALGFHEEWPAVVAVLIDLESSPNFDEITHRILRLALDGYSFREIGKMLGMSHNTAIKKLRNLING